MTYDEITQDMRVRITVGRHRGEGTVVGKDIVKIGGKDIERVYINTDKPRARLLCSPRVLEKA